MSLETNRSIALRFTTEGWGTRPGWREVWDELVAPDAVHHFNGDPDPVVGLTANKAFNATLFAGFPALERTVHDVLTEGDRVVYRSVLSGAHTGPFLGFAPTGASAVIDDFTMLRIAGGRIAEWWYCCNLLALVKQLGLLPDDSGQIGPNGPSVPVGTARLRP